MRIDAAFPSAYLKAADLQGQIVTVSMSHVTTEDIGGDHKPVLYFHGKDRGLVLNKTNSNTISASYGYETDDWAGKPIQLFEQLVDFQGRQTPAIRVRVPRSVPAQQRAQPPARPVAPAASVPQHANGHAAPPHPGPDVAQLVGLDDEIPF